MKIHSRKMNVSSDVNFKELARCTDDFNGAQLKAVCVEAGMIALRRGATELIHEDYMEGIYKTMTVTKFVGIVINIITFLQEYWKFKPRRKQTLSIMHELHNHC